MQILGRSSGRLGKKKSRFVDLSRIKICDTFVTNLSMLTNIDLTSATESNRQLSIFYDDEAFTGLEHTAYYMLICSS